MRASTAAVQSLRSASRVLVFIAVLFAARGAALAVCVGDCNGVGTVTIDELILGVNIALNLQPPSACSAFENAQGQVDIAQLIQGVNNSLNGCPAEPTATATATVTNNPDTPTGTATAVAATDTPAPTATATAPPADTATSTPPPSATATDVATATPPPSTSTATSVPTSTPTDTVQPTATAIHTSTATATSSATATTTETGTPTPTSTPTSTEFPVGVSIAGRAALIGVGLNGVGSVVSAIVIAETNDGTAEALVFGDANAETPAFPRGTVVCPLCPAQPPGTECLCCPVNGVSTRTCTAVGPGIEIALGADACIGLGPSGGTAELNGAITISAAEGTCPFAFTTGTYTVDELTTVYRDDMMVETLSVAADLNGTIEPTASGTACAVSALTLTLNGTLTSELPDGSGVTANFEGASVTAEQIVYGPDCVPLSYKLTFSGSVTFSPQPSGTGFVVQFTGFVLDYAAMTGSVEIEFTGTVGSTCFGGATSLTTVNPLTMPDGELCPHSGNLNVSGTGGAMAMVTYQDGQVTVEQGGSQVFPSCLSAELMMCP